MTQNIKPTTTTLYKAIDRNLLLPLCLSLLLVLTFRHPKVELFNSNYASPPHLAEGALLIAPFKAYRVRILKSSATLSQTSSCCGLKS